MNEKYNTEIDYYEEPSFLYLSLKGLGREIPPLSEPYDTGGFMRNLLIHLDNNNKITGIEFEIEDESYFDENRLEELIQKGRLNERFDENMPYSYNPKSKKFKWIVNDKESYKKLIRKRTRFYGITAYPEVKKIYGVEVWYPELPEEVLKHYK